MHSVLLKHLTCALLHAHDNIRDYGFFELSSWNCCFILFSFLVLEVAIFKNNLWYESKKHVLIYYCVVNSTINNSTSYAWRSGIRKVSQTPNICYWHKWQILLISLFISVICQQLNSTIRCKYLGGGEGCIPTWGQVETRDT